MLILRRKKDEKIVIEGGITITVVETRDHDVRIGIEAPREIAVHREEVARQIGWVDPASEQPS